MRRRRNPWIQKKSSLGNFDISSTLGLLLMGYGVYCLLDWGFDFVRGLTSPRHG